MRKDELALQIDQLFDLGRRSYDDLKDAEKDVLTALLIQKSKNPLDYIAEVPGDNMLPMRLAKFLLDPSSDNRDDVMDALISGGWLTAESEINKLLEARAELEAYYNPSREPSETELMVMAHNRAVAADINSHQRSQLC